MRPAYKSLFTFMCAPHILAVVTARTTNLLGALAMGVADAVDAVARDQAREGGPAGAALCLVAHEPGLSIEQLRRALGLSHPGAVRLIDRLAAEGAVERRASRDKRAVALHVTASGARRVRTILAARRRALAAALAPLSPRERSVLDRLLAKMLRALPRSDAHALAICRFCEGDACHPCPVGEALEEKAGQTLAFTLR
jgi:MarR family transcriptional regulator, negative regulator of the multidrug operon emrRAB